MKIELTPLEIDQIRVACDVIDFCLSAIARTKHESFKLFMLETIAITSKSLRDDVIS